jgi:hypothetical protein
MLLIVELIQQLTMNNEQNRSIKIMPTAPMYPALDRLEHLNPIHSTDILAVFALLTGIIKLWRSTDELRKLRKFSPKVVFPIVSALLAIVKAILQMNDKE